MIWLFGERIWFPHKRHCWAQFSHWAFDHSDTSVENYAIANLDSVFCKTTDYDEVDEYLTCGEWRRCWNCDPNDGQGCNREFTCMHDLDISPYMAGDSTGEVVIRLVNSDQVTLATGTQGTLLTSSTCDGAGNVGQYLLSAKIVLDGCGSEASQGVLNDLWFDGQKWKCISE